jgi:hypothetical protein
MIFAIICRQRVEVAGVPDRSRRAVIPRDGLTQFGYGAADAPLSSVFVIGRRCHWLDNAPSPGEI